MSTESRNATTTTIVLPQSEMSGAAFQASLVGLSGSAFGTRYLLGADVVVLGRDPETTDVTIQDSGVSRVHARIERTTRGHRLVDCGSKNGTTLDGARVSEAPLRDGQQIAIGKSVFKYLRLNILELQYHDRMARLSATDELTGLANRRAAYESLTAEISRSRRHGHALAVCLFDIDHFKNINDTHGHAAGDDVLVGLSRRVEDTVRTEDTVARIGGEEFLIILPETDVLEAAEIATRVRDTVAASPFRSRSLAIDVTVSLGVADLAELSAALVDAHQRDNKQLLDRFIALADAKLYEAKHMGRNRVAV